MICEQARLPGVSTAQVARRYSMNANLLFKWLRDPAFMADHSDADQGMFLPVEISDDLLLMLPPVAPPRSGLDVPPNFTPAGRAEITAPSGPCRR